MTKKDLTLCIKPNSKTKAYVVTSEHTIDWEGTSTNIIKVFNNRDKANKYATELYNDDKLFEQDYSDRIEIKVLSIDKGD